MKRIFKRLCCFVAGHEPARPLLWCPKVGRDYIADFTICLRCARMNPKEGRRAVQKAWHLKRAR